MKLEKLDNSQIELGSATIVAESIEKWCLLMLIGTLGVYMNTNKGMNGMNNTCFY